MDDLNAEIERRQAIADAATPGEWAWGDGFTVLPHDEDGRDPEAKYADCQLINDEGLVVIPIRLDHYEPIWDIDPHDEGAIQPSPEDRAFIAHARTGYPQCLAALKLAVAALEDEARNVDPESNWQHARNTLAAIKRALEAK